MSESKKSFREYVREATELSSKEPFKIAEFVFEISFASSFLPNDLREKLDTGESLTKDEIRSWAQKSGLKEVIISDILHDFFETRKDKGKKSGWYYKSSDAITLDG